MREIGWLAGRSSTKELRLVDINDQLALACEQAPAAARMRAVLHVRLSDGSWLTGVEATVAAWRAAGVGARVSWLLWPPVRPFARLVYAIFARHRHALGRLFGARVCDGQCWQESERAVRRHFQRR
jgi:predicted DCC family thiol-disulfide oxidoreductase YuxK